MRRELRGLAAAGSALTAAGTALAAVGTVHAAVNAALLRRRSLAERNPVRFWKCVSCALGLALFLLLLVQFGVKTA